MKIKRFLAFGASLVLSLSSLFAFAPVAHAATISWDGGGTTNNFSEGANWSGDVVPGTSDDVIFDNDTLVGPITLTNDLVGAQFQSITFTGSSNHQFTLDGSAITLSDGISNSADTLDTIEFDIVLNGPQTIDTSGGPLQLNGVLSGSGNITKTGSQSLSVSGNNSTYSGSITISDGSLLANHTNALGTVGAGTTVADGAQLSFSNATIPSGTIIAEPLTLAGDGNGLIWTDYALGDSGCYSPDCPETTSITLSGPITLTANTQFAAFAKIILTGPITGNFTMTMAKASQGKIVINSSANGSATPNSTLTAPVYTTTYSDSQPGSPITANYNETVIVTGIRQQVFVDNGGILKGTGTVGTLTVSDGGKLAPGMSPGCLNSGNLSFTTGSTYEFEVGGATECTEYDQTKVTGTVTLGNGTLSVLRYNDFKPVAGQTYKIIDNDSNDAVTGTFDNLAEGAEITVDGYVLGISYVGGDGNDVVLTVKTVPGTPNTGFELLTHNPLATFAITTLLAGSLVVLSKRARRLQVR